MSTKDLQTKVTELKDLKAMAEELQAEITAIEDELKAECIRQGTEELQAGIFKIRYKAVQVIGSIQKPLKRLTVTCTSNSQGIQPGIASRWHKKTPLQKRQPLQGLPN